MTAEELTTLWKGGGETNPLIDYNNQSGLFGISNGTWDNMGQFAGLAGTGFQLYDSLFGDKSKLYKEQIGMLKDQRANNNRLIANKEKFKSNIGSGLASAFATT